MDETLALPAPDFALLWAGFLRGDREAQEQLLAACYHELRSLGYWVDIERRRGLSPLSRLSSRAGQCR